jgi:5-methylcytosine-specific restriction endonuclease McrA
MAGFLHIWQFDISSLLNNYLTEFFEMPKRMTKKQKDATKHLLANDWGFGLVCFWCRQDFLFDQLTLDHLRPSSKGGTNNPENLRLTCRKCNASRGNSLFPPEQKYKSLSLSCSSK